jgi:hypothetical protein
MKAKVTHEEVEEEEVVEEWCPETTKYAYNEHMALAAQEFWKSKGKGFKSRDNSRFTSRSSGEKTRTCYNCGLTNHFIADCPYEKREEHGGKLVRKEKAKFTPNKNFRGKSFGNKNSTNKKPHRMLVVQEEYLSGDDDEDEEENSEVGGVASIAIVTTNPTPTSSLFDSPNDNIISHPKCLMANATAVTNPPPKSKLNSAPLDCEDSLKVKLELVALDGFLSNLHGETKVHVEALMSQLGEMHALLDVKENEIIEMQGHSRDYADEICALSQELENEQQLRLSLEESHETLEETNNLAISKLVKDRDHSLALAKVLKNEKSELEVGHAKLVQDHENLQKEFNALTSKFSDLHKAHAQLQVQLTEQLLKFPQLPIVLNAPTTNSCCDHDALVEENSKLKAQLEKGLVTCIQGEKNLNDLLVNQKEHVGKEGIGFGAKAKKKKNKSKKKKTLPSPPNANIVFVKEGEMVKEKEKEPIVNGDATRGTATHNDFAGKYNPSYVLCRDYYGHVYAKYVGPYDGYVEWAIWVPKILVTNKRGPIQKWVPKTKN